MVSFITPSERAAEALVRAHLNGRSLPPILHGAVVWMAAARLTSGKRPVLDETLRTDIDNQTIPQPECIKVSTAADLWRRSCALLLPETARPVTRHRRRDRSAPAKPRSMPHSSRAPRA